MPGWVALLVVSTRVAKILSGVGVEAAPGVNDLQVAPPGLADV